MKINPLLPKQIKPFSSRTLSLSAKELARLKALANKYKDKAWNTNKGTTVLKATDLALVKKFKDRLKEYLFEYGQGRYCCYCGAELHSHKATYDIEHIIAKNNRSHAVFHLKNLALACKPCNTRKGTKSCTTNKNGDLDRVWLGGERYIHVHPHFDKWSDHLCLDSYRRVLPVKKSKNLKGQETIRICGIHALNAARLSDYFDLGSMVNKKNWERLYISLHSGDKVEKSKYEMFLKLLEKANIDPSINRLFKQLAK